jgi:hypothetical protein
LDYALTLAWRRRRTSLRLDPSQHTNAKLQTVAANLAAAGTSTVQRSPYSSPAGCPPHSARSNPGAPWRPCRMRLSSARCTTGKSRDGVTRLRSRARRLGARVSREVWSALSLSTLKIGPGYREAPPTPSRGSTVFGRGSYAEALRIGAILGKETVGGALLVGAAVAALVWANSPWVRATSPSGTTKSVMSRGIWGSVLEFGPQTGSWRSSSFSSGSSSNVNLSPET